MTRAGEPLPYRTVQSGPALHTGGNRTAPGVQIVGRGASAIEELVNVSAPNAPTDSVLVKDADGVWRPRALENAAQRGSVITFVDDDLSAVPPEARPGDFYISLATSTIYEVQET